MANHKFCVYYINMYVNDLYKLKFSRKFLQDVYIMISSALLLHNNGMSTDKKIQQRNTVSRWQNIDPPIPTPDIKADKNSNINVFPPPLPSSAALPSLINVTLPSLLNPPTQPAGLLSSSNLQPFLGEIPGLSKSPASSHPIFAMPPNLPPLRVFDANGQRQPLPPGLVDFFPSRQQQNFLPPNQLLTQQSIDFVNTFLGNRQENSIPSLNTTVLSQRINNGHTQTEDLAPSAEQRAPLPMPVPPLPPNSSSMEVLMVPPPPPPPPTRARRNSQCLTDSPMDIEDDQNEIEEENEKGKNDDAKECEKKGRNKKVQMADELMKRALRPYFKRRRITKDEYKEIMKKGVAKLKKRQSLKVVKVENFVSKYVQLVSARRKNQYFGY